MDRASVSIASSAVLYGLSVYTVFPIAVKGSERYAFRLTDHFRRLVNSAKIIGIDTFTAEWDEKKFTAAVDSLVQANNPSEDVFVRATVHVVELLPGTRARGLKTTLSLFMYEAASILPLEGARLKTSVWRRVPDYAIPSRAKVNGAYVNSVLAKQDAIDSGYDDCILLDVNGHVCELSAANIFLVREGVLITPGTASDILEGINRRTVLEMAGTMNLSILERNVDLTELYIADEVFACGTSAFVTPILAIDSRVIGDGKMGSVTGLIRERLSKIVHGEDELSAKYCTTLAGGPPAATLSAVR